MSTMLATISTHADLSHAKVAYLARASNVVGGRTPAHSSRLYARRIISNSSSILTRSFTTHQAPVSGEAPAHAPAAMFTMLVTLSTYADLSPAKAAYLARASHVDGRTPAHSSRLYAHRLTATLLLTFRLGLTWPCQSRVRGAAPAHAPVAMSTMLATMMTHARLSHAKGAYRARAIRALKMSPVHSSGLIALRHPLRLRRHLHRLYRQHHLFHSAATKSSQARCLGPQHNPAVRAKVACWL